ncbi:MAG: hypothetical protein LUH02_04935 [Erysipelotrichaceae bacterium]|nr:hypothetical protein [Erysipelotrichaceae bacterium]
MLNEMIQRVLSIIDDNRYETIFKINWIYWSLYYFFVSGSYFPMSYRVEEVFLKFRYVFVIVMLFLMFIAVLRIHINNESNKKELYIFLIIAFLTTITTQEGSIIITLFIIFLAIFIDFNKFIVFDFKFKLLLLIIIVGSCILGITYNSSGIYNVTYKMAMGFKHPNVFTLYVCIILLEYIYISTMKYKWLIVLPVFCVTFYLGRGRTSAYAFIFICSLFAIKHYFSKYYDNKIIKRIITLSPILFTLLSFILGKLYGIGNSFVIKLNSFMTGRIAYMYKYWSTNKISLLGRKSTAIISNSYSVTGLSYVLLDNAYIKCLIQWGLIGWVYLMYLYIRFFMNCFKNRNISLMLFALFFVVLGLGESQMLIVIYNVTLLALLNKSAMSVNDNNG